MTVRTRSVAVTPSAEFAGELHADDFGQEHVDRLAEHDAFGLDAADAPADDAEAVDHRGVAVGADEGIGEERRALASLPMNTTLARYSRLTWWTMPVAGGTTRKLLNAFWPQLRNS